MTLNNVSYLKINDMLTQQEWSELSALKDAISYNPASVTSEEQELFTQLLIRSFETRGEAFCDPDLTYSK